MRPLRERDKERVKRDACVYAAGEFMPVARRQWNAAPQKLSNRMGIVLLACGERLRLTAQCLRTGAVEKIKQIALLSSRLRRLLRRFIPVDPDCQTLIVRIGSIYSDLRGTSATRFW